jgi:pimeloyl-ACP methyl ester carboxylesterase
LFFTEVVPAGYAGTTIRILSPEDLAAYRANPVWPVRAATAGTILREIEAEASRAVALDALGAVRQPVLQVVGSESLAIFRDATNALDARLADGRIVAIAGARHAAHHTHPDAFVAAIRTFLT